MLGAAKSWPEIIMKTGMLLGLCFTRIIDFITKTADNRMG